MRSWGNPDLQFVLHVQTKRHLELELTLFNRFWRSEPGDECSAIARRSPH